MKRATLAMTGGKEPRQHMWEAIRLLRRSFTQHDIIRRSGQGPSSVETYFKALAKAKVIEVIEPGTGRRQAVWKLARDEGIDHPRLNHQGQRTRSHIATENIWRTLRILRGELTAKDIAETASVGDCSISEKRARRYLKALVEAGYVVRTKITYAEPATYRLIPSRDTGPRHPVVREQQSLQVYDQNLNKVVFAKASNAVDGAGDAEDSGRSADEIRLRGLLAEWLALEDGDLALLDLALRTQLELAGTATQETVQ